MVKISQKHKLKKHSSDVSGVWASSLVAFAVAIGAITLSVILNFEFALPRIGLIALLAVVLGLTGVFYGKFISTKVSLFGFSKSQIWSLVAMSFVVIGLFLFFGFTFTA